MNIRLSHQKNKKQQSSQIDTNQLMTWNCLSQTVAVGIIIGFSACVVCSLTTPFFLLNENQLMYLYSATAQVIAGVFGLTLTAYVFFADRLRNTADDDYYEVTISLLRQYYWDLCLISSVCGLSILCCVWGIISLNNLFGALYNFIIDLSIFYSTLAIISIIILGILLLNPNSLDKELESMAKSAEASFYESETNNQNLNNTSAANFATFIEIYNRLDEKIIEFASALNTDQNNINKQSNRDRENPKHRQKPQILQSIDTLYRNEIINNQLKTELYELRRYRNGIVHGFSFDIPSSICDHIKAIYNALNEVYTIYNDYGEASREMEEWHKAIRNLSSL